MPRPVLSPAGEWLYDRLAPWAVYDSDATGWPVATVCAAAGAQLDQIFTASETGLDALDAPATAPVWYLEHLAMKAGVGVAAGWAEQDLRALIRDRPAERRGTRAAMIAAAQVTLTGSRTVRLVEKAGGDAYALTAITRTAETPDPSATEAALLAAKPVGLVLTYVVSDSPVWDEATLDWDTVGDEVTWDDVAVGDV